jgi:hypothetical protein
MNRLANRDICEQAVEEVDRKVQENKSCVAAELRRLSLGHSSYGNWRSWNACPGAFTLSRMVANGYDVMYILTGKRTVGSK